MNPIHTIQPSLSKIHFNIVPLSQARSSDWSLPFKLHNQTFGLIYVSCKLNVPPNSSLIILSSKEYSVNSKIYEAVRHAVLFSCEMSRKIATWKQVTNMEGRFTGWLFNDITSEKNKAIII
jgi:hypothetical protein